MPTSRPSRGFTLLELIVVLVVLAVLAAIATPTFNRVIERSHDEAAVTSLTSYAREVQAVAAFRGDGRLTGADFTETAGDLVGFAVGLSAAKTTTVSPMPEVATRNESGAVISYAIDEEGRRAGLAAVSESGNCVAVAFTATSVIEVVTGAAGDSCNGQSALEGEPVVVTPPDGDGSGENEVLPPAAPTNIQVDRDGENVFISWSASPGATGYRLYKNDVEIQKWDNPNMTGAVWALQAGESATFHVTAHNAGGESGPSASSTVENEPSTPEEFAATVDGSTVKLTWKPVENATSYRVRREGTIIGVGPAAAHDDHSRAAGTYNYTVEAGNSSDGWSPASAPLSVVVDTYTVTVQADEPVAYYRMNDTGSSTGNSATTSSRLADGSYVDGHTLGQASPLGVQDSSARSVTFNGGHVRLPSIPANLFNNGVSYETWVNIDPTDTGAYPAFMDLGNGREASNILFGRHGTTNQIYVHGFGPASAGGVGYGRVITPTNVLKPGTWQHLAFTWAPNGTLNIYVDGVLVHTDTMRAGGVGVGPSPEERTSNYLGRNNWGNVPIVGGVSEAALYNRALTGSEIAEHYAARN